LNNPFKEIPLYKYNGRARQQMEKRALDMILKSILNEDFKWF